MGYQTLNLNFQTTGDHRRLQLSEFEELRNDAYDLSKKYKDKMKWIHDKSILRKDLFSGQKVFLYDSKLHLFLGKLKSHWTGLFVSQFVTPYGIVTLMNLTDGTVFQENGHRAKLFLEHEPIHHEDVELIDPTSK